MYIGSTVQVHRQGSEASLRAASARMPRLHEPAAGGLVAGFKLLAGLGSTSGASPGPPTRKL